MKTSYFSGIVLFFRESLELLEEGRGRLILIHFCRVEFFYKGPFLTELAPDISDLVYATSFWRLLFYIELFFVNCS